MKVLKVNLKWLKTTETLGDAEFGRLIRAAMIYALTGEVHALGGNERILWPGVKDEVDSQRSRFNHQSEVNKNNVTNRYESLRIVTNRYDSQARESTPPTPPGKENYIYIPTEREGSSLTRDCDEVIDFLNQVAGTKYKHMETSRKPIRARLNDGFTVEDCKEVIRKRWKAWRGTEWQQYMRPDTLFRASKFEGYLQDGGQTRTGGKKNTLLNYDESRERSGVTSITLDLSDLEQ